MSILSKLKDEIEWHRLGLIFSCALILSFILSLIFSATTARIQISGIFLGEWIFILVLPFVLIRAKAIWNHLRGQKLLLWALAAFFLYSLLVHFFPDSWSLVQERRSLERVLRHSVLFLLPVIWIGLGVFIGIYCREDLYTKFIFGIIFLTGFTASTSSTVGNLAIGPLFVFFLPWSVAQVLERKTRLSTLILVFSLFSFFLLGSFQGSLFLQRTTFLIGTFGMIFGVVWLGSQKKWSRKRIGWISFAAAFVYLVIGWKISYLNAERVNLNNALSEENRAASVKDDLRMKILGGLQHADDVALNEGKVTFFESRFRRELWKESWSDWQKSPWFGRGFAVEVPSMFFASPNAAESNNVKGYSFLPISGPHNSYLNILVRLGVVGFGIWLFFIFTWSVEVYSFVRSEHSRWVDFISSYGVLSAGIYSFFHLGLEGPHYAIPLYFFMGSLYGRAARSGRGFNLAWRSRTYI